MVPSVTLPFVALDAIPTPGLDVVVGSWADAAAATALGGSLAGVSGRVHVERVGVDIGVTGRVEAAADVPCDRCGQTVRLSVASDVSCLHAAPRGVDESIPESAYAEVGEYDGVTLDLAHAVAESLLLERPARVLCADADLSQDEACLARWRSVAGGPERAADPRLAVLRSLKFSS